MHLYVASVWENSPEIILRYFLTHQVFFVQLSTIHNTQSVIRNFKLSGTLELLISQLNFHLVDLKIKIEAIHPDVDLFRGFENYRPLTW